MKYNIVYITISLLLVIACKNGPEQQVQTVKGQELDIEVQGQQPYLTTHDDKLYMSYTQRMNDSLFSLHLAELENNDISKPRELARGNDWFVNWADFPVHAIGNKNNLIHYLQKSDGATYAYDIKMVLESQTNASKNIEFKLHSDSTKTEHGFVSILPYNTDSFFVTWLDGRNTGGGGHDSGHGAQGAMNIRAAQVKSNGQVVDDFLVDSKTCDCCQTSAAITAEGPVIIYRDRSDDEIRDIFISRQINGIWSEPYAVYNDNWKINGCPVNGPKAAYLNNTLVVAWFTAANNKPKVNISFSTDNGATFDEPFQIDNGTAIGRVDVALIDNKTALLSWMESTEAGAQLKAAQIGMDTGLINELIISDLSASRASGFPQMELLNKKVYFAWNHIKDKEITIKLKSLDLNAF